MVMSRMTAQKIKLLVLWDILSHRTDEEHALSTDEIIELLAGRGIEVSRKVLPDDIALLNEYGYEVLIRKKKFHYYYVVNRPLEAAEAIMLTDMVQASKLSSEQKRLLQKKLAKESVSSEMACHLLRGDPAKRNNKQIFYNIDTVEKAIAQERKLSFLYYSLNYEKEKVYRREGRPYTVNPLGLTWSRDNYYLVCYDDKHEGTANYRVDRMEKAELGRPFKKKKEFSDFSMEEYRRQSFAMFTGWPAETELLFTEDMTDEIFDRFGQEISVHNLGEDFLHIRVMVRVGRPFFLWVAGTCGKVRILAPEPVRKEFNNFIQKVKESY